LLLELSGAGEAAAGYIINDYYDVKNRRHQPVFDWS
jgi:4-hydroxybenzoate polyprenyltransferase